MHILTFLCILFFSFKLAVSLEAVTIPQRLPSPRYFSPALYDGDDGVFLLGGTRGLDALDEVVQFSLSTEEIQIVGRFPSKIVSGTAEFAQGARFYIGGYMNNTVLSSYVWITHPFQLDPYPIGGMPEGIEGHCSAFDGDNSIYIFGGYNGSSYSLDIKKYSISSGTTNVVSNLPDPLYSSVSIWFNNSAYIFGGRATDFRRAVYKFTPSAQGGVTEVLPVQIPLEFAGGDAVTDGRFIYLLQGFAENAIVVFNPSTLSFTVVNVANLDDILLGRAVYVAKTNRIYVFGGFDRRAQEASDRICYINL